MADSADLVVLGAWYGTGNKGLYHPRYRAAINRKIVRRGRNFEREFLSVETQLSYELVDKEVFLIFFKKKRFTQSSFYPFFIKSFYYSKLIKFKLLIFSNIRDIAPDLSL